MKFEDIDKMLKGSNHMRKMKLYARKTTGDNVVIWIYSNYKRKAFGFPAFKLADKPPRAEEIALLKRAITLRNEMEEKGEGFSGANKKEKVSKVLNEWINHYTVAASSCNARMAAKKFLDSNGDIPAASVSRLHIIKMIDSLKKGDYSANYVRDMASRARAFCNWAEQRGYMSRVDTRKLIPPETFGEVKILSEAEIKRLADAPLPECPDLKDLFMLGIYTAQRICEMKAYTFSIYYDKQIRVRQGKTGKFIIIPLSAGAMSVLEGLRQRRLTEGASVEPGAKVFSIPSKKPVQRIFSKWLESADIPKGKVTLRNSRSTAISLLINRGVPESVTQELANHSDVRTTAKYYRQIDDRKKREALELIPTF